ncbi:MAG TPA: HDOD domain-containing protein [Candidatus Krumholzibacteria bacterium]|nr:HDOD domain-containing protein [Candidatus Krumholzibacteria bacterium]HRX49840.1 HDOD domain-containing protein [Candidatus Krumholzibacteria bacterium]
MRRILFVDDEQQILDGLRDRLRRKRRTWEMTFVASGREALERLEAGPCDVIVSDMRMPVMDGVALLTQVRARHPEAIRIVLSGYAEQERLLQSVPVAHQFLTKPCSPEVLEKVIDRICDLRSLVAHAPIRRLVSGIEHLPSATATVRLLSAALEREDTTLGRVMRIVSRDPAVAVKILQAVNSGFVYSARPIVSLEDAVCHLGLERIRRLAQATAMTEMPDAEPSHLEALREHAVRVADRAATCFADILPPAEVHTAALLHDVGRIVLAAVMPEEEREIQRLADRDGRQPHEVERELLGITHARIGGYLLGLWGLPAPLVDAAAHHHDPSHTAGTSPTLLTAVHVTDRIMRGREVDLDLEYLERIGCLGRLPAWRERIDQMEPAAV